MAKKSNSNMAIASFVLGLISLFVGWVPILGQLPSILAIVFGAIGLNDVKKNKKTEGKPLAIWGICLGAFWLVLGIFLLMLGVGFGIFSGF